MAHIKTYKHKPHEGMPEMFDGSGPHHKSNGVAGNLGVAALPGERCLGTTRGGELLQ